MADQPDWRDRLIQWLGRGGLWGFILPLAVFGLFLTGGMALIAADRALAKAQFTGTGACLIAAALAFGFFVSTLMRK